MLFNKSTLYKYNKIKVHSTIFICYFLFDVPLGLIHANHGDKIIDYLLQQLKGATSDVSIKPRFR